MATITGLTAARMLAIEDATVVSGAFDSAGHLIMTRENGTTFDAGVMPDATSVVKGIVELATIAETTTGTDAVRAVTPAGVAASAALRLALTGGIMSGAITVVRPLATDAVISGNVANETFDRARIYADGKYEAGPGTGARDTNFYRASAGLWKTDHSWEIVNDLSVGEDVSIGGVLTVTGPIIGASNMNMGAWTSWTPTWTTTSGSATPSFGNAAIDCKYSKIGRTVHYRMNITFGSTTNFGTSPSGSDNWLFSMPVAAPASGVPVGYVSMWVGSTTKATAGLAHTNSTTQIILYTGSGNVDNSTLGGGIVDSISPLTWANGDRLSIFGTYESAA